jgi:hypothetical protein
VAHTARRGYVLAILHLIVIPLGLLFWLLIGIVMAVGGISIVLGLIAGGLNQPLSVWLGLVGVGAALIVLAWRINRHLVVLRAAAPSSRIIVSGESEKSG